MKHSRIPRHARLLAVSGIAALTLAACGTGDPLGEPGDDTDTDTETDAGDDDGEDDAGNGEDAGDGAGDVGTIVVGSQAYYSNEIIAEIYAQALEDAGHTVDRQFQIGQRDVYLQAMEGGEVHLLPEYSGNLLQHYDDETEARSSDEVADALPEVLPDGLTVLEYAEAEDADSYNVTTDFSEENGITSLADLAGYDGEIIVGGNAELESRPYGPEGLAEFYGVEVSFVAIGDSGGPLTKGAIRDGTITMGDIYTADPDLASGDFVTLDDPENMILAQNVLPLVDADLAEEIALVLDPISAVLTTEELIALNVLSVEEEASSSDIAADWLSEQGLLGGS
ncbi:ABC transporter substrate-binding protein [Bogoriella caseilytica]|uniref:Osmoprotectant transport system substrate-binding protein n=1 Tax=Bogoriella caseilytica TaxID=56055 RepID=A0A3N2BE20_9MICO|nr:ABC transporter substrate-binding protein [Bogoriella caseilytica]ROR73475.1 osmoprotectant transport system substrate-binding protein [Bogoriella caseilytica]